MFLEINSWIQGRMGKIEWKKDETILYADLFLYGFPILQDTFCAVIFPKFRSHLTDLVPRYCEQLMSSVHLPLKNQKMFKITLLEWLEA